MNSPLQVVWSVVGLDSAGNAADAVNPWIARLALADDLFVLVGGALIVVGIAVWLRRGRPNPLAGAPDRPSRLQPEHLLGVVLVFLCIGAGLDLAVRQLPEGVELTLTAGGAAQLFGGLVCLGVAARFVDAGWRRFLVGSGHVPLRVAEGVVLVFVAVPLCGVVLEATGRLFELVAPDYGAPEHAVIEALRNGTEPAWALWIGAAVIAPVSEELFFRGLMQTFLRRLTRRPWAAVVGASLIFALAHFPQPQAVPAIAVLGVILGVSYERNGSLVGPITLHVLFNLKTLVWEGLGAGG